MGYEPRQEFERAERAAGEIMTKLDDLVSDVQETKDDMTDMMQARDDKLADLENEVKTYGSEFADTRERVDVLAKALTDGLKSLQPALNQIDVLSARLDQAKYTGTTEEKGNAVEDEAIAFFHQVHIEAKGADYHKSPTFDPDDVTEDKKALYIEAKSAFNKMFRFNSQVHSPQTQMSASEQKAISTLTHGSGQWLPMELSDKIIECWEDDTQFEGAFDSITIGKETLQMLVDYDEDEEMLWNCETAPRPENGSALLEQGLRTFETGEAMSTQIVTNRMLEDADIDIPSWIVKRVARKMAKGKRRALMLGDGKQKPDGILNEGNHTVMQSASNGGKFSWMDLVAMHYKMPEQYRNGAQWWMHETALIALMTMQDADGRPIFSPQVIQSGGAPKILGKAVVENTYMPSYVDETAGSSTMGQPIVGSKPIALGNWREGYLRVNRRGFTVIRDPWSYVAKAVAWHFSERCGGGVKCPNAMWFLQIKA